jgi:hypothetical protein
MSENYSASEMMIAVAARMLKGARTVFVGVGLPNIACNLARVTVAPDMEMIYESGVYGARPERLPLSIGDPDPGERRRLGGIDGRFVRVISPARVSGNCTPRRRTNR